MSLVDGVVVMEIDDVDVAVDDGCWCSRIVMF